MLSLRPSTLQVNAPVETANCRRGCWAVVLQKSALARFRTLKQLNWHVQPLWPLAPGAISLPPHLNICKLFVGSSRGEPFFCFCLGEPGDSLVPDVRPPCLPPTSHQSKPTWPCDGLPDAADAVGARRRRGSFSSADITQASTSTHVCVYCAETYFFRKLPWRGSPEAPTC